MGWVEETESDPPDAYYVDEDCSGDTSDTYYSDDGCSDTSVEGDTFEDGCSCEDTGSWDTFTNVTPVCRFYGALAGGPNSHFFTASPGECEFVKGAGGWYYEGIGFNVVPQANGNCPSGMLEVNRAYNDRFSTNDSNHRYSTSDSTMREMSRRGWIVEGTVWCSRP